MKRDTSQYWFRAKRYGYGWSYALNFQGWFTYAITLIGFVIHFSFAMSGIEEGAIDGGRILYIATSFLWIVGLTVICYKKGEPAKWRWGEYDEKD